jgi:prolyl 4-hydroxylase
VDQAADRPWPLLILDHNDNEHFVHMEPGDMVLYESAKLLHGRPEPFVGEHYDNIFAHYQPISGWDYSWV